MTESLIDLPTGGYAPLKMIVATRSPFPHHSVECSEVSFKWRQMTQIGTSDTIWASRLIKNNLKQLKKRSSAAGQALQPIRIEMGARVALPYQFSRNSGILASV